MVNDGDTRPRCETETWDMCLRGHSVKVPDETCLFRQMSSLRVAVVE